MMRQREYINLIYVNIALYIIGVAYMSFDNSCHLVDKVKEACFYHNQDKIFQTFRWRVLWEEHHVIECNIT